MPAVDRPAAAGSVAVVDDEQPQPGLVVRDHPGDLLARDEPGVGNFAGEVVETKRGAQPDDDADLERATTGPRRRISTAAGEVVGAQAGERFAAQHADRARV